MTKHNFLKDNPLMHTNDGDEVLTAKDIKTIESARSDADQFVTMSFRVRKKHLKKLKDYAFTHRIEIKEALDKALAQFLDPIPDEDLIEYVEKPRRKREK